MEALNLLKAITESVGVTNCSAFAEAVVCAEAEATLFV